MYHRQITESVNRSKRLKGFRDFIEGENLLEERLIEAKNYYWDEILGWYESQQALQEEINALEKELLSQKGLSELK